MNQYLAQIKMLVDNIVAAGPHFDSENILMYILNRLPPAYNAFKTAIRTSQLPISLDVLYLLLCSEEINIQSQLQRETNPASDHTALYAINRGRGNYRGRGSYRGRGNSRTTVISKPPDNASNAHPICQIIGKTGHTALTCWHRCNLQYSSTDSTKSLYMQPNAPYP